MSAGAPFLLCSWEADFMEALLERALADTGGDIGSAVFIFPHGRPEKYLSRLLRLDSRVRRPLIMPQCLTARGLFSAFRARIHAGSAWNAGLLDRVGLLLECARKEWGEDEQLGDARYFFPWGLRLAALFEECFVQHRKAENFFNTGGQVSPFAEALLARLAQIFERYAAGLAEREWSTPGLDASLCSDWLLEHNRTPPGLFHGTVIYIAGFHSLTGSEDLLFRHLWEQRQARIMLHADPALCAEAKRERAEEGVQAHWSCRALEDWAARWKTVLEPLPEHGQNGGGEKNPPRIRYYEGFDLHSQLTVLERELTDLADGGLAGHEASPDGAFVRIEDEAEQDQAADTVVVLPDSGLLMPALHHLPPTNINLSMGYPLSRSPLFRLLDTLARLQEGRRGEGYYWRDLRDLVRHPYIKMLRPPERSEAGQEESLRQRSGPAFAGDVAAAPSSGPAAGDPESGGADLRRELYRLERALHERGLKYAAPRQLLEQAYGMLAPEEMPPRPVLALLDKLLEVCLDNFERPGTPRELGQALEELCSLLLAHGKDLWRRFLIDAECLYRLMQSLIPELCQSQLADESLPSPTLFTMLRRLMEEERVPFEAAPLVGLQVMGMLETRLLSFRRVVVLDACEDRLPGMPASDPLLPEALRLELGLPPLHAREQVAAYHFFRLLRGAGEVILLWQEGGDTQGIQEGRKKKSRFIEELLWEEEKDAGRLLRPGEQGTDGPLTVLTSAVAPVRRKRRALALSPDMRALTRSLLERPLSASLLDAYLRCPVRFFYQRLTGLAPAEDINEGDDPAAVGELFHQVLHEVYSRHEGGPPLPGGTGLADVLGEELIESLYASPAFAALGRSLPADSFAMLASAGRTRLYRYLELQPPGAVLALERHLSAPFVWKGLACTLAGKADRIDRRSFPADAGRDGQGSACPANGAGPSGKISGEKSGEKTGESLSGIVIIDYKTGRVPFVSPALWDNPELWRRMRDWQPDGSPDGAALLPELARLVESVQLPLYLLMYALGPEQSMPAGAMSASGRRLAALDAAWVDLGESGEEKALFPRGFSPVRRREAVETDIPELLHFLLRHILESRELVPQPGRHCDWCSCAKLCMVEY